LILPTKFTPGFKKERFYVFAKKFTTNDAFGFSNCSGKIAGNYFRKIGPTYSLVKSKSEQINNLIIKEKLL